MVIEEIETETVVEIESAGVDLGAEIVTGRTAREITIVKEAGLELPLLKKKPER